MKRLFSWCLALLMLISMGVLASGLENAQKIAEIRPSAGTEPIWVFLQRLPSSFEAQVFYGLLIAGLAGLIASWLNKWRTGEADGFAHFYDANGKNFFARWKYPIGQMIWLVGASIGAILTVSFQTDSGEFFGWMSVIAFGGFMGFSGEMKTEKPAA